MEHLDNLEEQYFGASKYQRDLLNMWWKRWRQQGFASLQSYNRLKKARRYANIDVGDVGLLSYNNGTYRPCQVLRNDISTSSQAQMVRVGYEEGHGLSSRKNEPTPRKEIVIGVQRLALLVPTGKVELLRMSTEHDFKLPGACCPGLPWTPPSKDDDAAGAAEASLRLPEEAMKAKDTERDSM